MSVNDPLQYLAVEERCITEAAGRGRPVLGICLGSQLIARTLGASVRRNPLKEIGWFDIHLTGSAAGDPLLSAMEERETVFHWHGETWDLPHGAVLLASSELCPNQAFRHGANVYGLQFHLEVTPQMIADWMLEDTNCGDVREITRPVDPLYNAGRLAELSEQIFGRWCKLL